MYEHYRNDIIAELSTTIDQDMLQSIIETIDRISSKYEITEKNEQLSVYQPEEIPMILKMYIASRGVAGLSKKTLENKTIILKRFLNDLNKQYNEISANDIRVWLFNYENSKGVSKATIEKYRQVINTFYQWCVDEEYMQKNPCKNIGVIKTPSKHKNALTVNELEVVRDNCRTDIDKAIVEFLVSSGCRVGELIGIKTNAINWNNRSCTVTGKGNKEREVYFSVRAFRAIKKYLENRKQESEWLFCSRHGGGQMSNRSVENLIGGIEKRCGADLQHKLTPHTFRHTFATFLLNNANTDITTVSKALGHSSISTTQVYLDLDNTKVKNSVLSMVC